MDNDLCNLRDVDRALRRQEQCLHSGHIPVPWCSSLPTPALLLHTSQPHFKGTSYRPPRLVLPRTVWECDCNEYLYTLYPTQERCRTDVRTTRCGAASGEAPRSTCAYVRRYIKDVLMKDLQSKSQARCRTGIKTTRCSAASGVAHQSRCGSRCAETSGFPAITTGDSASQLYPAGTAIPVP